MAPEIIITPAQENEHELNRNRQVSFGGVQIKRDSKDLEIPDVSRRGTICSEWDDADSVDLPAELPPPPDGGWGWVVVFVSFLANMVVDGTAYSFSPFLEVYSEYFNEPKGTVAWISSLLAGVYLSAGPIVSGLTNKYGCRPVCIAGSIIASAAYASTFFANSVVYLMVTQGLVAGFGFGLIYLPAVVCVSYYFETKRALATGIAVCGSGVGTMIFPPLINLLIDNFGWRGANLFIAGLILNCCWMGALMRPLEVPKMKRKDLLHRLAEEKLIAMELSSLYGSNYITVTHADGTVEKKLKPGRVLNPDPGVHSHLNLTRYLTPVGTSLALSTIEETGQQDQSSGEKKDHLSPVAAPIEDEKDSLVQKSQVKTKGISVKTHIAFAKIPRNKSQPSMAKNGATIPQIVSVPNFDRKMSKLELVNQIRLVPATPQASYTNLKLLDRRPSQGYGRVLSTGSITDSEAGVLRRRRSSKDRKGIMLPPLARQDVFYSGSIRNLQEFKSQSSMLSYRESTYNLQSSIAGSKAIIGALQEFEDEQDSSQEKCSRLKECCSPITTMMDMNLLKNPIFMIVGFANMIGMLGFYTPFVYLPAAAVEKGIDKDMATFLVSVIGITNTIGRVLSGFIADLPSVNALWVNNISIVFSGLCVFLIPFAYSFTSFVTIAVFFGFFVSAYISLTSIILVELLGLGSLTNAFGLLILFRGSASMVGPPLAGSIYDWTKSYDISFYFSGILLFICAGLHCTIPFVQKYSPKYRRPAPCMTNKDILNAISEEDIYRSNSPDAGEEGDGIMFDIKPKVTKEKLSSSQNCELNEEPDISIKYTVDSTSTNKYTADLESSKDSTTETTSKIPSECVDA